MTMPSSFPSSRAPRPIALAMHLFRIRIEETIGFVTARNARPRIGGFAASYDADSEGEEGKFYVWTKSEIDELPAYCPNMITQALRSIRSTTFHTVRKLGRPQHPQPSEECSSSSRLRAGTPSRRFPQNSFRAAGKTRIPPGYDDKVLADWNGLDDFRPWPRQRSFLPERIGHKPHVRRFRRHHCERTGSEGRLHHSWRDDRLRYDATAEGYAHLITAALALNCRHTRRRPSRFSREMLRTSDDRPSSGTRQNAALSTFRLKRGGAHSSRHAQGHDDATPNGNAVMLRNLAALTSSDRQG